MTDMTTETSSRFAEQAARLRAAFDGAFAAPARADAVVTHDLLAIRIGAEPCAIRLSEIAGLFADRSITPIPGGNPALLGIAGFRGVLLPVYGLGNLFDQPGEHGARWLVIAAAAPIALAFDVFEGHLRVPANEIAPRQSTIRGCAGEFVRTADDVRPVLHLPSVIEALGAAEDAGAVENRECIEEEEHG